MMTMKYMIANINPSGIRKLEKPEAGLAWKNVATIMMICKTDPFFYLQTLVQPRNSARKAAPSIPQKNRENSLRQVPRVHLRHYLGY
jgi:hypothetical protein